MQKRELQLNKFCDNLTTRNSHFRLPGESPCAGLPFTKSVFGYLLDWHAVP